MYDLFCSPFKLSQCRTMVAAQGGFESPEDRSEMEVIYLNVEPLDPDEKLTKDREKKIEEFKEESDIDIYASQSEMDFEKMCTKFPLTLDFLTGKRSRRSWMESCSCGNYPNLLSFSSIHNANMNLGWYSKNSAEHTYRVSWNRFHKRLSFLKFPLNFCLSEVIGEYQMNHRKKRIIKDTAALFPQRSLRDVIGNEVISLSELWKFDGLLDNAKTIAYLKGLLVSQLGMLDEFVNQPRLRSHKSTLRTLEPSGLPFSVNDSSLQMIKSTMLPQVNYFETKLNFGQRVISTFSVESTPSEDTSINTGNIQCLQMDGMLYFIFSVDDDPHVIYMARPQMIESSSVKAMHNLYSFYSVNTKNNSRSHCSNPTNLIAQMKVSSSIVLKPNCGKAMETEFILYDSNERLSNELHKSSSVLSRSKGFSNKVTNILRRRCMRKSKSFDTENKQILDGLADNNVSSIVNYAVDRLLPNLELAAIVVEEYLQDTSNDSVFGGWGLKFLEKASEKAASSKPLLPPCCSENSDGFGRLMNVLIPAGPHGGPLTQNGDKSSLLGRWRSGGHCDCGGWDLGCPLRVLNYSSNCSNASHMDTEKRPLNLFMEGTRNSVHPTLSLMKVREGFYSIQFQSSLSVLQSFSIAVAAIHTKITVVVLNPNFEQSF